MMRVALIFGEMESDPPHQPPQGIAFPQIRLGTPGEGANLLSYMSVQFGPPGAQHLGGQVFQAFHGRSLHGQEREFLAGG